MRSSLTFGLIFLSLFAAAAQTTSLTASLPSPAETTEPTHSASPDGFVLKEATPIKLRLNRAISSTDSHVGDTVDFEVVDDIHLDRVVLIRKGAFAFGKVTKARPSRNLARGAELEINVDYVELLDSEKAPLRAVRRDKGGSHLITMTAAIAVTGLLFPPAAVGALAMHGKEIVIPKGAEVTAYVNEDMDLDLAKFSKPLSAVSRDNAELVTTTSQSVTGQVESHPPLGLFQDHTYTNEYFALSYRLPLEWVVETDFVRKKFVSSKGSEAANVLLAAVRIPQDVTELVADPSFTLLAVPRSSPTNTDCKQYLDGLTTSLRRSKKATPKGEITAYTIAGHEFSRAHFTYRLGTNDRAVICSPAKEYLLLWNIEGAVWDSVDDGASTIHTLVPWPPARTTTNFPKISIPQSASIGLLVSKVQPVYPVEARQHHIHGTIRLRTVISTKGDVENVELVDGPPELVASAVTAVRHWKYRPYQLNGEPIAVFTDVVINYSMGP